MTQPHEPTRRSQRDKPARKKALPGVAAHARGGKRGRRRGVLGFIGIALAVLLVSATSIAAIGAWDLAHSAKTVSLGTVPKLGAIEGSFNIMLIGSDTRTGQSNHYGSNPGSALNDVNILIHVSQDHQHVTAVSIPRDLVVPFATCPNGGGWTGPINALLSDGGVACIVKTVEQLTGLSIPYAGMVTFDGVVALSNAVGGVRVCVASPINDSHTWLKLSAGWHTLVGYQALAFLRTRHGVGDGSDLGRISDQQLFLSSLMRKIKSENVLENPITLYNMAKALVSNMTLSTSLDNPDTLVSMAMALRKVNLNNIVFVEYPGSTGGTGIYKSKVKPDEQAANALFAALRADQAVTVTGGLGRATTNDPTATATPTPKPTASSSKSKATATPTPTPTATPVQLDSSITGQSADQTTCANGN